MGKQYIVKGAMAQCNQSKVPMIAQLNLIPDNMFVNMNGNPVATTMTLGPVFGPAPFGICNMIPPTPAVPTPPCVCAILSWSGADTAVKINMISNPLTTDSKGTCALGGSISFKMSGQFPKPSIPPIPTPAAGDMNAAATNKKVDKKSPAGKDSSSKKGKNSSKKDTRTKAKNAQGLTPEEKAELKKDPPAWSDEIVDQLISMDEANIYIDANLKEVQINGKACLIRTDLSLDEVVDDRGRTNRERMSKGLAPLDANGDSVELHHIGQKSNAGLAELTNAEHHKGGNDTVLHDKKKVSEIDRKEFDGERKKHWETRAGSS